MKKFLSIIIMAAMVLSLVQVMAPAPVAKAVSGNAIVNILIPDDGHQYTVDDYFYVNAAILNPTDGAMSGDAIIDPGLTAGLVVGEVANKSITVPAHGVIDVWWQLECTAAGDSTIKVSFNGASKSITVHQFSPTETKLKVTIIEPDDDLTIPISTDFVVKATVEAPLQDIENVAVTISFDNAFVELTNGDPYTWNLGHVYKGDTHYVTWNLHCKGNGNTTITVSATGDGVLPAEALSDSFTVHQGEIPQEEGPFNVALDAYEKVCTNCGNLNAFNVTANVSNKTGHQTLDTHAEISIVSGSDTASFVDTVTLPLDQITVPNPVPNLGIGTAVWHVLCHAEGDVVFEVHAYGWVDMNDNNVKDAGDTYVEDTDTRTVQQRTLITDITDAWTDDNPHVTDPELAEDGLSATVCDDVYVKAVIRNCTCVTYGFLTDSIFANNDVIPNADNVEFAPGDMQVFVEQFSADPVTHAISFVQSYYIPINSENPNGNVPITSLCDCCEYIITWHLHCKAESIDTIKVATSGINPETQQYEVLDYDSFKLDQGTPPALTKVIEFFPGWYSNNSLEITPEKGIVEREEYAVSQNWTAAIVVSNIGGRVAEDVYITLGADGGFDPSVGGTNGHATLVYLNGPTGSTDIDFSGADTHTFYLGDIDPGKSAKILLEAHCSDDTNVTFTVPGDTVIYDPDGVLVDGETLITDVKLTFYDVDGSGTWDAGEPVVYDEDDLNTYNKRGLTGTDPLTGKPILASLIYNVPNEDTIKQIPLTVEFLNPTAEQHFQMSTKFAVKVSIYNGSAEGGIEDLSDVVVTLHWDKTARVELWQDSENPKIIPLIEEGETSEVSWEMHCTGPGSVKFWVEIAPGNTDLYIADSSAWDDGTKANNSVTITQDPETTLEVTIISPLEGCLVYANGEEFAITAKVENTGSKDAENVVVDISFAAAGYFEVVEAPPVLTWAVLGAGDETPLLTWTLKVLKGDAPPTSQIITVEATADNALDVSDFITVWPYPAAYLKVEITPLTDNKVDVGSDFDFNVKVTNIGWADAYDVWAEIELPANVALQPGFNDTKIYVGTLQGHGGALNFREVTFKLQCEGAGKAQIIAYAYGKDEYGYTWECDTPPTFYSHPGTDVKSDSVSYVFEQVFPNGPMLNITSPVDGFASNSSDVTVVFSTTGGTAPYTYAAKVDDAAWVSPIPADSYTFHNLADGNHTLYIMVTDNNNLYYIGFANVTVDKTPPPAPVANPVGGIYQGEQNITLLDAEDGVSIYYALDDPDLPLASFTPYTTPITIGEGEVLHVLRAYAVDAAGNKSSVMIQSYQILPSTITFDIPLIAGWNFISVPFTTSTSAFTNCSLFIGQSGSVTTLEPGEGYFVLNIGAAEDVTISGLPNASGFEIAATGTWQFIGNPFEVPVDWSTITGAHITLAFYLDTATSSWEMVDLSTDSMQPGVGYIIITSDIGNLVFQRP